MAVDTRNKRASAVGLALAFSLMLPSPDGSITNADWAQCAASYAGIAAGIPVIVDTEFSEYLFGTHPDSLSVLSNHLGLTSSASTVSAGMGA